MLLDALKKSPDDIALLTHLLKEYNSIEDYPSAIKTASKILTKEHNVSEKVYFSFILALILSNDFEEAEKQFNDAIKLYDNYIDLHYLGASLYEKQGHDEKAMYWLNKYLNTLNKPHIYSTYHCLSKKHSVLLLYLKLLLKYDRTKEAKLAISQFHDLFDEDLTIPLSVLSKSLEGREFNAFLKKLARIKVNDNLRNFLEIFTYS